MRYHPVFRLTSITVVNQDGACKEPALLITLSDNERRIQNHKVAGTSLATSIVGSLARNISPTKPRRGLFYTASLTLLLCRSIPAQIARLVARLHTQLAPDDLLIARAGRLNQMKLVIACLQGVERTHKTNCAR